MKKLLKILKTFWDIMTYDPNYRKPKGGNI